MLFASPPVFVLSDTEVLAFDRKRPPVRAPRLAAEDGPDDGLATAIAECIRQLGRPVLRAYVVHEGVLMRALSLPLREVPAHDELRLAVQTEAERYAMFRQSAVRLDFQVLSHGHGTVEVVFTAAREEVVAAIAEAFNQSHIAILALEPLPAALVRGLASAVPAGFEASAGAVGVAAYSPHRLELSLWENGKLKAWRSIVEEPGAEHQDLLVEFKRSLLEMRPRRWLTVDLPAALAAALPPGAEVTAIQDAPALVARGARGFRPGGRPLALDLLAKPPAMRIAISPWVVGVAAGFLALLGLGLGAHVHLTGQVAALAAEQQRLTQETTHLQTELTSPAHGEQAPWLALVRQSSERAALLEKLSRVTPPDVWLEATTLDRGRPLRIDGVALGPDSPMAFARGLQKLPELRRVELPMLKQDVREGVPVYVFTVEAELAGQEVSAP